MKHLALIGGLTAMFLCPLAAAQNSCEEADLVLYNTTVYTANDAQWTAEAVASRAGRIV